jgi:hypothetical protein
MQVRLSRSSVVCLGSVLLATACGGAPPPVAPSSAPKAVAIAKPEPPPDVSSVQEPAGLIVVGRVAKPEGILKTVGTWTRLPLPGGADLVRSMTDDAVASVVDLSQPIDGAVLLGGSKMDPKPVAAFSVAVRSFDSARTKLAARHKLTPGPNGSYWVAGVGKSDAPRSARMGEEHGAEEEEEDDDTEGCALAHGATGARLVCGEKSGVEALTPYLSRTLPRQQWPADVHVEVRFAPTREPAAQLRAMLPILGRGLMGNQGQALRDLLDAAAGEMVDFVGDSDKMTLDAQLADAGASATMRVEYQRASSFIAKVATSSPDKADVPPAALWRMPAETDLAFYSRGSEPKHFDRPRELIGNIVTELAGEEGMPEAERKTLRDLVADRVMPLFTGGVVYGKGFDQSAVEKAVEAKKNVKPGDGQAEDAATRALGTQVIGWHLLNVNEPIAKVGPMLKEWGQLWARPGFTKWVKSHTSPKMMAQVRTTPLPAGVTLPKDAVHLEITIPREDLEVYPSVPASPPPAAGKRGATTLSGPVAIVKAQGGKKLPRKPIVFHVIAVPDGATTWLGFGLDAKAIAQKAAASLSSATGASTFGKTPMADKLRSVKANAAWVVTLRGLLVVTAMDRGRTPFGTLGMLEHKGTTPITMTFAAQGPSPSAASGTSVTTFNLSRAAIEDIVKLVMNH